MPRYKHSFLEEVRQTCPHRRYLVDRYLYLIMEPHANVVRYIGASRHPYTRWGGLISEVRRNLEMGPGNHCGRPVILWLTDRISRGMIPKMLVIRAAVNWQSEELELIDTVGHYNADHGLPSLLNVVGNRLLEELVA